MKIKVWGCHGSLPTPSRNTIRYGDNTTCLEVRLDDGTLIVIDAGSGFSCQSIFDIHPIISQKGRVEISPNL